MLAAQLVAWGRRQQSAGILNATDVALMVTDESLSASRRSTERAEAQVALQELSLLLGEPAAPLATELRAPALLAILPVDWAQPRRVLPGVPAFDVRTLPAQLLAQRPDVASAHQRWLATLAQQRSVDARRYPQLSLGAMVGEGQLRVGGQTTASSD